MDVKASCKDITMKKLPLLSLFSLCLATLGSLCAMENVRLIKHNRKNIPAEIAYFSVQQQELSEALTSAEKMPQHLYAFLMPNTPQTIMPAAIADIIIEYALPCDPDILATLEYNHPANHRAEEASAVEHADDEIKEVAEIPLSPQALSRTIRTNLEERLATTKHILTQLHLQHSPLGKERASATCALIEVNIDIVKAKIKTTKFASTQKQNFDKKEQLDTRLQQLKLQQEDLKEALVLEKDLCDLIIMQQEARQIAEQRRNERADQQARAQQRADAVHFAKDKENWSFISVFALHIFSSRISTYINKNKYLSELFKKRLTQEACPSAFMSSAVNFFITRNILTDTYMNTLKAFGSYIVLDLAHKYGLDTLSALTQTKKQKKHAQKTALQKVDTLQSRRYAFAKEMFGWGIKTAIAAHLARERI